MFRRCAFTAARAALADVPRASSAASLGGPASRDAAAAGGAGFGARRWMSCWVVGSMGSVGGAPGYVSTRPPVGPARIVEARPHQRPAIPETGVTRWDVNVEHGPFGRGGGEMELTAVPKRKVTPSRKGKRNQFKRIRFVGEAVRCADCGKVKKPHVYCDQCSTNVFDHGVEGEGAVPPAGKAQ